MPVQLFNLAQVFNNNFFRVPDYQRGYSWEEPQLSDFWMDLSELPNSKDHYVGVLNVDRVDEENIKDLSDQWIVKERKFNPFFVVDGQQRLTTCIIAIKAMLDSGEDLGEEEADDIIKKYLWLVRKSDGAKICLFGYEKDNPSFEFWKSKILGIENENNDDVQTTYTRNLKKAYDFFAKKIAEKQAPVKSLYTKLTSQFKFNFYEIDPSFDVHVTFETMNNRGKDLSKLELLKNRFIYLSSLLSHQHNSLSDMQISELEIESLRNEINNVWKTIYEYLGKSAYITLKDDDFLKHHWAMYFGFKKEQADEFAKFLLDAHFTARNLIAGKIKIADIKEYIASLKSSIKNWYKVLACDTNLKDEHAVLGNLNVIEHRFFMPLILAGYSKIPDSGNPDFKDVVDLLHEIENFSFLAFGVYGRNSTYYQTQAMTIAHHLFKGFDADGRKYGISHVIKEIQQVNRSQRDVKRFAQEIASLYSERDRKGFYSWKLTKYLLYKYEKYLQEQSHENTPKIFWNSEKMHIEHIYPQNPSDQYWRSRFSDLTADQRWILTHSIGNLLLLNRRKNAALSSRGFDIKRSFKNFGYAAGTLSENQVANYDEWTPTQILDRGIILMRFIENEWGLDFGSDTKIKGILNLEFIP